jgi:hypothetical protein
MNNSPQGAQGSQRRTPNGISGARFYRDYAEFNSRQQPPVQIWSVDKAVGWRMFISVLRTRSG